jgi:hypothetical protein
MAKRVASAGYGFATHSKSTPEKSTVAGLFADPPDWLVRQLEKYREDPTRHLKPLCTVVAAEVLDDGARASEVEGEVEKALEEDPQG